jgi:hypothetical protein
VRTYVRNLQPWADGEGAVVVCTNMQLSAAVQWDLDVAVFALVGGRLRSAPGARYTCIRGLSYSVIYCTPGLYRCSW